MRHWLSILKHCIAIELQSWKRPRKTSFHGPKLARYLVRTSNCHWRWTNVSEKLCENFAKIRKLGVTFQEVTLNCEQK